MKILIFEYLTSGGWNKNSLSKDLVAEGLLMLTALINDLQLLEEHQLQVLIDTRLKQLEFTSSKLELIPIYANDNILEKFSQTLATCDAVWIIAPETNKILFELCQLVEATDKILLTSPTNAIALTADKWRCYQHLSQHQIATVTSQLLTAEYVFSHDIVLKIRDGVGCEDCVLIQSAIELHQFVNQCKNLSKYILQPYIAGNNYSISAIFQHGAAELICLNRQLIQLIQGKFKLLNCEIELQLQAQIQALNLLTQQIAAAIPSLWGYVGIDLIWHQGTWLVLEINPRLTSSYAGINPNLDINPAALVLKLLDQKTLISQ